MIHCSLYESTIGALFSSPAVASELRTFLHKPSQQGFDVTCDAKQLQERCREQLEGEIDRRSRGCFRLGDIERLVNQVWSDDFLSKGQLPLLNDLFQQLMQRNGDFIHYRDTQVEAYARLSAEIDPALLVGWHLAAWLDETPRPGTHDIQRIVNQQTAFFAPPATNHKPYAENHVHLGGIAYDGLILAHLLLSPHPSEIASDEFRSLRAVLRALVLQALADSAKGDKRKEWLAAIRKALDLRTEAVAKTEFDWNNLFELASKQHTDNVPLREMLRCLQPGQMHIAHAWQWLQYWLWQKFRLVSTPLEVRAAILWLQIELMSLRKQLLMDGQGLTRFTRKYRHRSQFNAETTGELADNIERIMAGYGDLAEIKLGTNAFSPGWIAQIARAVLNAQKLPPPERKEYFGIISPPPVLERRQEMQKEAQERWHFCLHFIREGTPPGGSGKFTTLARHDPEKCWREARQLNADQMGENGWSDPVFLGGMLNQKYSFQPARWLRGLDVASDENRLSIEWFAPVLRWLRRGMLARPLSDRAASASFHLSIHAGEDYAHPLSGMRHVDETVRFCEMREGDRLGHALALGIPPAYWAERHGDMLVPIDEHLDNLVWTWHYATELSPHLALATQILPRLERRIARFAPMVEWLDAGAIPDLLLPTDSNRKKKSDPQAATSSPERLFQAWLLRRNCHFQFEQNADTPIYDDILKAAVPDFSRLREMHKQAQSNAKDKDNVASLYLQRQRWHRLNKFDRRIKVLIRYGEEAHEHEYRPAVYEQAVPLERDWETAADYEFMHALQDFLLDRYDRMGLIIETNPTSNVYIARLEAHSEHPIFRWNPPDAETLQPGNEHNRHGLRRGANRVLINTDDPGIMPTTLRTEYALLREAAIKRGVSRTVAEDWLERLRVYGIEQFQRNHLPVFAQRQD